MFLHFNMRRVKCLAYNDAGAGAEFYFCWRAYLDGDAKVHLAQGFSLGSPADDGHYMRLGEERAMNDPKFTVELPDVEEGETKRFVLDLFAFESDFGTLQIKKTFTNEAAQKIVALAEAAQASKEKLLKDFSDWLIKEDNELVAALVKGGIMTATGVTAYVPIAKAAIKTISWVAEAIQSNGDDYMGHSRAELLYTKIQGKRHYRWIFNEGASVWKDAEEEPIHQDWRVHEGNGDNVLDCRFLAQVIAAKPNELKKKLPANAIDLEVPGLTL